MKDGAALSTCAVENVVIQAGECSVSVLPRIGGKISSILVRGHELLQAPLAPIAPRTPAMPFDASDASGWDECLPSVANCQVTTSDGTTEIADHGDLWRVEWTTSGEPDNGAPNGSSVTMLARCFSLPLMLERTLNLSAIPAGWRLTLDYKLTNAGKFPAPWSWAAHPLFTAAPGDRVLLPESIHRLRLEGSGGKRLGKNGDTVNWPVAMLAGGGETDLSVAQPPASEIGDKLFAGPLAAHENWAALERPSAGVRIRVGFDPEKTPYLGLWICHGGWPERPGPKQTCVALEPATAPVDSLAEQGSWSRELGPGNSYTWTMNVDLELI